MAPTTHACRYAGLWVCCLALLVTAFATGSTSPLPRGLYLHSQAIKSRYDPLGLFQKPYTVEGGAGASTVPEVASSGSAPTPGAAPAPASHSARAATPAVWLLAVAAFWVLAV